MEGLEDDSGIDELISALEKGGFTKLAGEVEDLRNYRERLEGAMMAGNIAWWGMQLPSGKVEFNPRKAEMIGYSPEQFEHYSDFTDLLHPEDYERAMQAMRDHLEGNEDRYEVEYRIESASGDYRWFYDIGGIIEQTEEETRVVGVVVDITERKELQFELKESLAAKEVFIDEIFHRMKNNLQQLSSLLGLQARETESSVAREALEESSSRIGSLAELYDEFSRGTGKEQVQFDQYLPSLVERIADFHRTETTSVSTQVEVGKELSLQQENAVYCGLILNELLTNAIKYGTGDREEVEIMIDFSCSGNSCKLQVADDGPGLPTDFDLEETDSLGLEIVKILAEKQLGGQFEIESTEKGTTCTVEFER